MRSKLSKFMIAVAAAAVVASSSFAPAQAGGKEVGAFIGGALLGGLIASRPYVAAPPGPGYVAPAPVYVAPQPRCYWQRQKYYDPYYGWRWNRVWVCG